DREAVDVLLELGHLLLDRGDALLDLRQAARHLADLAEEAAREPAELPPRLHGLEDDPPEPRRDREAKKSERRPERRRHAADATRGRYTGSATRGGAVR